MNKLFASLITLFAFAGLHAQSLESPHLIVQLTIDQLRTDYLEAFSSLYGEDGFKRLWREAMVIRNLQFSYKNRDRASSVATIYTGTTPSLHGIVGESWYDISTMHPVYCVDDPAYMGTSTSKSSSPVRLLASTVTDELKIFTQHKSKIYAVSPFRDAAVFSAGHAADAAFWIDEESGKWCGTTYYGVMPYWAGDYNITKSIDNRISNIVWGPYYNDIGRYKYLPTWNTVGFKHRFGDAKTDKYSKYLTSPYINDEVNSFTNVLFANTQMGKDDVPDMLCLTYYAGNYEHQSKNTLELQDAYVRLDASVASLLSMLEKQVGLKNVLFLITSTGYVDGEDADMPSYRIPQGEFNMKHCSALLNMYLMALYGNGQYVEGYYGDQLFLNHKLIERKKMDMETVQDKAVAFLMQFTGVEEAHSAHELMNGAWSPRLDEMRKSYCRLRSGDLSVTVLPGWSVVDEQHHINKVVRNGYIPAPLIILGGGYKPAIIDTPVNVDCIAPTIASCLHIRAPNASTATPLRNIQ